MLATKNLAFIPHCTVYPITLFASHPSLCGNHCCSLQLFALVWFGPYGYYAKRNKSEKDKHFDFTHIWSFKKLISKPKQNK